MASHAKAQARPGSLGDEPKTLLKEKDLMPSCCVKFCNTVLSSEGTHSGPCNG